MNINIICNENLNNAYLSKDVQASCRLVPPFILNKHIHPIGISKPKYHCYMNYVIQLLLSILKTISHNFRVNCNTEGSLSKFLFETAHSAFSPTDVDALKIRLVKYDAFYGGQIQQDISDCPMMLLEVINKGSVPHCGSNDTNSSGVSLSEILFSFMLAKYIVCDTCELRPPPPHLSLYIVDLVRYISHLLIPLPCMNWYRQNAIPWSANSPGYLNNILNFRWHEWRKSSPCCC